MTSVWILYSGAEYNYGNYPRIQGTYLNIEDAQKAAEIHNQINLRGLYRDGLSCEIKPLRWLYDGSKYNNDKNLYDKSSHVDYTAYEIREYSLNKMFFKSIYPKTRNENLKGRITEICLGFQSLKLPALVLLAICDEVAEVMKIIPMYKKWKVITLILNNRSRSDNYRDKSLI